MIFRNADFIKRDFNCSNVVACVSPSAPVGLEGNWVQDDAMDISKLDKLWIQTDQAMNRIQVLGYL